MQNITYGSVCSGIEAATVAWHPIGWKPAWFAEIEPFPSAVLAHHYPSVPNLGDMTKIASQVANDNVPAPDVLVGGTPCQAFSVAGMRGGLSDARGQLTISFVELANAIDRKRAANDNEPCTIVWENVPGVLSSKDNAFGCFLAALAGESEELQPPGRKWANAGYVRGPQRTIAWRILDAQYFGVAQRRRRVFVIASAGAGFDPAAVLFEFQGVRRDTAPSRETGQSFTHEVAPCLTSSGRGVERTGYTRGQDPVIAGTISACSFVGGAGGRPEGAAAGHFQPVISMAHGQGGAEIRTDGGAPTLTCNHEAPIAAYAVRTANTGANGHGISPELAHTMDRANGQAVAVREISPTITRNYGKQVDSSDTALGPNVVLQPAIALQTDVTPKASVELAFTLKLPSVSGGGQPAACMTPQMQVRRLTPRECERLQAFPDDYTLVPVRNKQAADGPRYKALGNSMCVNVMHWIGKRVDAELRMAAPANDNAPAIAKAVA